MLSDAMMTLFDNVRARATASVRSVDLRRTASLMLLCGMLCMGAPLTACDTVDANEEQTDDLPAPPERP